ncbi:MAG TPA: hypothetical protein VGE52_06480, partial [Pirellulales bacterium]
MNLFARLVGRSNSPRRDTSRFPTSRAGRSTARRSAPALAIELLEQRWTPAVSVIVTNAHNVSIQDSDSGKTSNVVEIIDDYNDHNTYIKINGGAKTLLNNSAGAAGYLQNIGINMAGGDDKVIFSTIGAGTLDHDLERSLALGQGTDAFTLNLAQNLGDHEVTFTVWGQDGKDTYNVNGGFSNGDLVLDIVDHNGSDTYNLSPGFLSNGAWFNFSLVDVNGGANKFKLTQGNLNASYVSLDVHFNGDATNTITFAGNATLL